MVPIIKKKAIKRERKFSRFLFWFLLAVFLGICTYLLFFSPFLAVDKIFVEGNKDISGVDIRNSIEKDIGENFFFFLPKNNFFLLNEKHIGSAIKKVSKRLEIESVEKKFPESLSVRLVERKTELVWCSGGVCYFVDAEGLAYETATENEESLRFDKFIVIVDDSAVPVDVEKTKINQDYIRFIESADEIIKNDLGFLAEESYHTPGIASGEISRRLNEGWILRISKDMPIEETKKIIQTIFEKELNEEARKNLDYLDLRIKNKIYYKMKEEENNDSEKSEEKEKS